MRSARIPLILLVIFPLFAGCSKLTATAKSLIATGVTSTRERATAFAAFRSGIKAADPKEQADMSEYLDLHGKGLAADAVSILNISKSLEEKYETAALRQQLIQLAKITRGRADNWNLARLRMAPVAGSQSDFDAWTESHRAALDALADLFLQIEKEIEAQEKKGDANAK